VSVNQRQIALRRADVLAAQLALGRQVAAEQEEVVPFAESEPQSAGQGGGDLW
jgi:hypothetical protein